jgi:hypothetical protein
MSNLDKEQNQKISSLFLSPGYCGESDKNPLAYFCRVGTRGQVITPTVNPREAGIRKASDI